jgi:hypothetical protein
MGKVGTLKTLVVATVAAVALLTIAAVSGAAPGTEASVSGFDQCANGGPPSTATDCPQDWINGILNANNSHYAEDDVTPQRVILDLPKNGLDHRSHGRDLLPHPQGWGARVRLARDLEPDADER